MEDQKIQEMIELIVAKVTQKLLDSGLVEAQSTLERPKVLCLSEQASETWEGLIATADLEKQYQLVYKVAGQEEEWKLEDYDTVILSNLSMSNLAQLAGGSCDTPYSSLAQRAILSGKSVLIPEQGVEHHRYRDTAPPSYYQMLEDKLQVLTGAGMGIYNCCQMSQGALLGNQPCAKNQVATAPQPEPVPQVTAKPVQPLQEPKMMRIEQKRLITEADVIKASRAGMTALVFPQKTMVTALAKDCARDMKIDLMFE